MGRLLRQAGLSDLAPEQLRFLNLGRVVDTTKLRTEFGYALRWTTEQAFDDYVRGRGLRPLISPDWVAAAERQVLAVARTLG